jgi:hypothetical protein
METAHDWLSRLFGDDASQGHGRLPMLPRRALAHRFFRRPSSARSPIMCHTGRVGRVGGPGTRAQVVGLVGLMRAESATENLGGLATLNRGYSRGGVSSALRFACWSCALSAAEKSGPE